MLSSTFVAILTYPPYRSLARAFCLQLWLLVLRSCQPWSGHPYQTFTRSCSNIDIMAPPSQAENNNNNQDPPPNQPRISMDIACQTACQSCSLHHSLGLTSTRGAPRQCMNSVCCQQEERKDKASLCLDAQIPSPRTTRTH